MQSAPREVHGHDREVAALVHVQPAGRKRPERFHSCDACCAACDVIGALFTSSLRRRRKQQTTRLMHVVLMHVVLVRVQPADTGEPIKDWWQGQQLQQGSLRAGSWQSRIREECRNTQKRRGLHRRRSTGLVGLATQIKLTTGAAAWGAAPEGGAASRPRLSSPACSCSRGKHALGCAAAISCCIARQGRCSSSHAPPTLRAALPETHSSTTPTAPRCIPAGPLH